MLITHEFTLDLPPDDTYELLLDLERVTPCMPGASLGERLDDGSHAVNVKVKLGPMRFSYDGTVRIAESDAALRRAVLKGTASEARGQGSAEGVLAMEVAEAPGGSCVSATAEIDLTGRAAQMGHGVVESVSRQLIGQMTKSLSERFVDGPQPEPSGTDEEAGTVPLTALPSRAATPTAQRDKTRPLKAGALMWAVLRERIAAFFRRQRGAA